MAHDWKNTVLLLFLDVLVNMENTDVKLISKLLDKIISYLADKYAEKELQVFLPETKDIYLRELDKVLVDIDNVMFANFIFPNGKLKRLEFDLSDLQLNDGYKTRFNITNETLNKRFIIAHETVKYLGFNLDDILLAGCIRIGYNKASNECYVHYNSSLYLPTVAIYDVLEEILYTVNTVMITNDEGDDKNPSFQSFSYKNGDSIKDIRRFINQHRSKN